MMNDLNGQVQTHSQSAAIHWALKKVPKCLYLKAMTYPTHKSLISLGSSRRGSRISAQVDIVVFKIIEAVH